jgi:hypothetical protein
MRGHLFYAHREWIVDSNYRTNIIKGHNDPEFEAMLREFHGLREKGI